MVPPEQRALAGESGGFRRFGPSLVELPPPGRSTRITWGHDPPSQARAHPAGCSVPPLDKLRLPGDATFGYRVEVRMGFEPTYVGFANRCLTTWLPHHLFCCLALLAHRSSFFPPGTIAE